MTTSFTTTLSEYDQALLRVKQAKTAGSILNYHLSSDPSRGRQIHVESDQGWDPHPTFVEFEDWAADPAPPN